MPQKPAKLFCQTGALAGTSIVIEGENTTIGRQPSSDLVLYPHTVSSDHARIYFEPADASYYIEDLGSSNGTWIDRVRVEEPTRIDDLAVITFAKDIDFIFQILSSRPASKSKKRQTAAPSTSPASSATEFSKTAYQDQFVPPPVFSEKSNEGDTAQVDDHAKTTYQSAFAPPPDLSKKPTESHQETVYNKSFENIPPGISKKPAAQTSRKKHYMLHVNTKGVEERFSLKEGKNTVGRSSSCDITIQDPFISSTHAILQVSGDALVLQDLESSNKTYVNGKAIKKPVTVQPEMKIRFGPNSEATIIQG